MSSPLNMANINLTDELLNEEINKKAFEEISNIFDRYLFTEKLKKNCKIMVVKL